LTVVGSKRSYHTYRPEVFSQERGAVEQDDESVARKRRELARSLQPRLRLAFTSHTANLAPLHTAVSEYVDVARSQGEPVERVLIDLRAMLNLGGQWQDHATAEQHALAEAVIRWCIERYYGAERAD